VRVLLVAGLLGVFARSGRGGAAGALAARRRLLLFVLDVDARLAVATASGFGARAGARTPAPRPLAALFVAVRTGARGGIALLAVAQALDQLGAGEHPVALDACRGGELMKVCKVFGFELGLGHRMATLFNGLGRETCRRGRSAADLARRIDPFGRRDLLPGDDLRLHP